VLLDRLLAHDDLERRLEAAWQGRRFGASYERPLLILASLREVALKEGPSLALWPAIAAQEPDSAAATEQALGQALEHPGFWHNVSRRHVQTNETSRAVAWLWPAGLLGQVDPVRPLTLHDVGASAGLNLVADRLPAAWEDGSGTALALPPLPPIAGRSGADLRPLDATDEDDARWLLACVWARQSDREERLARALEAFHEQRPTVRQATAREVPAFLPTVRPDTPRALAWQTVVKDSCRSTSGPSTKPACAPGSPAASPAPRCGSSWSWLPPVPRACPSPSPPTCAVRGGCRTTCWPAASRTLGCCMSMRARWRHCERTCARGSPGACIHVAASLPLELRPPHVDRGTERTR